LVAEAPPALEGTGRHYLQQQVMTYNDIAVVSENSCCVHCMATFQVEGAPTAICIRAYAKPRKIMLLTFSKHLTHTQLSEATQQLNAPS
jgi:hypothetical protein